MNLTQAKKLFYESDGYEVFMHPDIDDKGREYVLALMPIAQFGNKSARFCLIRNNDTVLSLAQFSKSDKWFVKSTKQ